MGCHPGCHPFLYVIFIIFLKGCHPILKITRQKLPVVTEKNI